jgi:crotonobetaine/carnitine-CoA ligase
MTPDDMYRLMIAEGDVIIDRLKQVAQQTPNKIFLYYGDQDRPVSYADVLMLASRFAAGLQALGVGLDDRVSVLTRNSFVAALSMFATWLAGAIYCPVNFMYKGKLLIHQLRDTGPKVLISDVNTAEALSDIVDEYVAPDVIIHFPTSSDHDYTSAKLPTPLAARTKIHRLLDFLNSPSQHRAIPRSYSDIASIVYTSGTTGPSKGVLQPFRWINQFTFVYRKLFDSEDVIYCDLPLYHVGGAFFRVAKAIYLGATVALYDRFSPSQFWDRIRKTGSTHATLLDVMIPWLMSAEPSVHDRDNSLTKVHMQPLPLTHNSVAHRFGIDIVTAGFGQTETGGSFVSVIDEFPDGAGKSPQYWKGPSKAAVLEAATRFGVMVANGSEPIKKGFMGTPVPLFDVQIHDLQDNPCMDAEAGELVLRPRYPDLLLRGYVNRPDAMVRSCTNFWFHTGDAVYRDTDGVYFFVDRIGGFFRVRGENVSSYQIEDLLNDHPKVRASAAIPLPAEEGDEEDCAVFVQLVEGQEMTTAELTSYFHAVMPKYMVPKYVRFVETLPLTATNKIEKYKLKLLLVADTP